MLTWIEWSVYYLFKEIHQVAWFLTAKISTLTHTSKTFVILEKVINLSVPYFLNAGRKIV